MAKESPADQAPPVPPAAHWQAPMAWIGSPPQPVLDAYFECPEQAVFVRAALVMTLSEPIGPGMRRETVTTVPGLLRLEGGKPVEVHCAGPNGQCWTHRVVKEGRKTRWALFTGTDFPAGEAIPASDDSAPCIEQVVVQSLVPMQGSRKFVSFIIQADGRSMNVSAMADPDPDD